MIIRSINNQHVTAAKTYLSADVDAAGTSLPVKNINNFTDSWAVQVGNTGEERTEVKLISGSPATGTVNLGAALTYDHPVDTPIYCYKYNQVVFQRSTTGTAGTVSPLTDGTITITPDRFSADGASYTVFDDTTGSTSYAYKIKLRNSTLAVESANSDWIVPAGYPFYSLYRLRERAKAKTNNLNIDDETASDWLNEWHEEMVNALIETNRDYAIGTTEIAFAANQQYGTITNGDFKFPRKVWFVTGAGTYEMYPQDLNITPTNGRVYSDYTPVYHFRGDNVVGRNPSSSAGTMAIDYYKIGTQLATDSEELPLPMRGYTRYYVDYARDQANLMDRAEVTSAEMNNFEVKWGGWINKFKEEMAPRQFSGAEYIQITDALETEF